ncbi:MAG: hypothetical protein CFE44_12935 [Burkholderiales bacterium PBB4]|nr:MAG: hypothetical protein CFE44_12935 [Burkholderiales bacterium PBB4]
MSCVIEHLHRDGSVLARVATKGAELRLGRALDNDLVLDDPHCAPYHAVLQMDGLGQAELRDLGTVNGLRTARGFGRSQRHSALALQHDQRIEVGASTIRVRYAKGTLAPEKPLTVRMVWPLALLALALVIGHAGWEMWLKDILETSPSYLSMLTGLAVALTVWSAIYGLLGRIMNGGDRFFTHLLIVCMGYLTGQLVMEVLNQLAYSFYWLWPLRIATAAGIVIMALTVRAHLRVADPRHWHVTRWGVALAAALAIAVPVAQTWINSKRLTHVQLMTLNQHPVTRLAETVSIENFMENTTQLQSRVEAQRKLEPSSEIGAPDGE